MRTKLPNRSLFHLEYPANPNDYFVLDWGPVVTAVTNPIAMNLGSEGTAEFVISLTPSLSHPMGEGARRAGEGVGLAGPTPPLDIQPSTHTAFFRLRAFSLAQAGDLDGDGLDCVADQPARSEQCDRRPEPRGLSQEPRKVHSDWPVSS